MYAAFFGLKHEPFSIAPDPRYLFMSERHREALAHLLFGVNGGGGFVLLSGEIGAGKTTVCRCFLEQIPRRTNVAYIFNPKLTVLELLMSVCEEFGIPHPELGSGESRATIKSYLDPLNAFLLKTHAVGQNNVLIIDEAQMLSAEVLEQLRLLTNLETSERKLLQIILIGQPELRDMLERPELEQLAQRVIARFHLGALTPAETAAYIQHRLNVAGLSTPMPFDAKAIARIHQVSRGVPRRINLLCDRALLGAYALSRTIVDREIVDKAAVEAFGRTSSLRARSAQRRRNRRIWKTLSAVAAVALIGAIGLIGYGVMHGPAPRAQVASAASSASGSNAASRAAGAGASAPAPAPASATGTATSAASAGVAAISPATVSPASAASAAATPLFISPTDLPTHFKTLTRSENDAWRQLAPEWKLTLDANVDPCTSAARAHLECFRSPASDLAQIRQLDRPGILVLHDAHDQPVYALLTGLGANTATLRIGGISQTISLLSLATLWRGDFATLWRSPPDYSGKLVGAGSGAVAAWLGNQLATLRGEAAPIAGNDPSWTTRVAAFQLAQGLKPDGRAGPSTFMQVNRAIGVDEPRLAVR
jgi:general secretion pathway protein A